MRDLWTGRHAKGTRNLNAPARRQNRATGGISAEVTIISSRCDAVRAVPARALADDDPQLLDQLLAIPNLHLIVDGYNVTKTGYPSLTLADQRARLLTGLGGLAVQAKAEVTCVFDGAELKFK